MKNSRTVLSAMALVSAGLVAPQALAGKIENINQSVTLVDNQASIEHLITGGNAGASFSDQYSFTLSTAGDFSAQLFPRASSGASAPAISSFSLFDSNGKFIANSVAGLSGTGGWLIDQDNLAAGTYYLKINGALTSNAAFKYQANLSVGPAQVVAVDEPASLGLLLGGLGMLGLLARRRKQRAA